METRKLILLAALKKISTIFLGPFLIAYFIKTTQESMITLSIYNIVIYTSLAIFSFIVGYYINSGFKIGMYRIGVIVSTLYILSIIILQEQIIDYLWLVAILSGLSTATYYLPFNIFVADKIPNSERTNYELKTRTDEYILSILIPILLGSLITTTNYILTACIILIISIIQIVLSFQLTRIPKARDKFTPIESFKEFRKDKKIFRVLLCDTLRGFTISDSSLAIITTILIYNSYKSDLGLGIITSISSFLALSFAYIYKKKTRDESKTILLSSLLPIISLTLLILFENNFTIALYNISYVILTMMLTLIMNVRLFNISKKDVTRSNQVEFWSIREVFLCIGRVSSHILLLIFGIFFPQYLNYLLIFMTLIILLMGIILMKDNMY